MTHKKTTPKHKVSPCAAIRGFEISGLKVVDESTGHAIVHAILLSNESRELADDGEYYPVQMFTLDEFSYAEIPYSQSDLLKPRIIYVGNQVRCAHSKDYWEHWHHECDSLILVTAMTSKFKEMAVKKYPLTTLGGNANCIDVGGLVAVKMAEHDALKSLGLSFIEVCLINGACGE